MKKLTRNVEPICLSGFTRANNWNDCVRVHKADIWVSLENMQEGFCAYCECRLVKKHIEHFRCRDDFPALTFCWSNLFGSCCYNTRCGFFKDNKSKPYDPNLLIKPDEDDPSDYLVFLTTGKVRAINTLKDAELKKAKETIRVFNLNDDSALVNSRRAALQAEISVISEVYSLQEEFSLEDFQGFLNEGIASLQDREFQTALSHAWYYNTAY